MLTSPGVQHRWKLDLLQAVTHLYGLEQGVLVEELGLWGMNCRWRIQAADGQQYFLKEKPAYVADHEFGIHVRLHEFIQSRSGPVVRLLSTVSGEPFFVWRGRLFELQEYTVGRHLSPTSESDLRTLGWTTAGFHVLSASFKHDRAMEQQLTFTYTDTWQGIYAYTRHLDRAYQTLCCANASSVDWIRQWIASNGRMIDYASLSKTWLHGDVSCFNSLIVEDTRVRLVDLDNAHFGHRLMEIAAAIATVGAICQPVEQVQAHIYEGFQHLYADSLLQGLTALAPFTKSERDHWHIFLGLGIVRTFISWFNLDESGPPPSHVNVSVERVIEMLRGLSA